MRSLRTLMVAAGLAGIAPAIALGAITPEQMLAIQPKLKGVEYDTPNAADIKACKVETVTNADKKTIGYALRDGQGKLLRKYLDTRGAVKLDQWSYYLDGFEVYREVDLNDDMSLDECRWMNASGTRIASVKSFASANGKEGVVKVVEWKRISAEEASKVFVQALIEGDLALMETVIARPEELAALGAPKGVVDKAAEGHAKRFEQVKTLQQGLKGWNSQTVWVRLDATLPHVIPAGTDTGLKDDLILYENAIVFPGMPGGQGNPTEMAFLQAPEIVKVGDTWKFVELPRAVDPKKAVVAAEGGIRAEIFGAVAQGPAGAANPQLEAALKALAQFDQEHANAVEKKDLAEFHVGRVRLLLDVVKNSKGPDEQLAFNKQIVDSLAAAYQTGLYPKATGVLDAMIKENEGAKLGSYAAFRKIYAVFAAKNEEGGNLMTNQKEWMGDLKTFLDRYPKADEAPEALLQLASANEFNAEEEEARKYYAQLARTFPESDPGKRAAGALKRLDLVGKTLALKGPGFARDVVDVAQYRGKPLLVVFWTSYADPVKRDLPELLRVYEKHHGQGFEIVGVSLDTEPKDLEAFLKANPLPWPQIYEPGGLEKNPLANEFGIIALPTMFLVDAQGKVVNRNLRTAGELEKQLDKLLAAGGGGVALGAK